MVSVALTETVYPSEPSSTAEPVMRNFGNLKAVQECSLSHEGTSAYSQVESQNDPGSFPASDEQLNLLQLQAICEALSVYGGTPRERTERLPVFASDDEDVLDWDVWMQPPPPRRSGTIKVKLVCKGRSKPIPVTDPWAR